MKSFSGSVSAAGLALGLMLAGTPAMAQQKQAPQAPQQQTIPLKDASPASIAAAKEILAMKNASAMYAHAIPNIVAQTKNALAQKTSTIRRNSARSPLSSRRASPAAKEMGDGMAKIYATNSPSRN